MAVTVRYEAGAAGPLEAAVSEGHDGDAGGGEHIGDEESENRSGKGEDVGDEESENRSSKGEAEGGGEAGGGDAARSRSGGLLITAADVTQDPTDQAQLLPMIEAAEQSGGPAAGLTLADAGYFSAANLAACAARATPVAIPEARCPTAHPFHHSRFAYDPGADCYRCPEGRLLSFQRLKHRRRRASVRVYAAAAADCLACPAFGRCTTSTQGRRIEVSLHADALTAHRRWMQTAAGARRVSPAQTADRAGLRDHQGAAGRPPLPAARARGRAQRVDPAGGRVQPAHARQGAERQVDQRRSLRPSWLIPALKTTGASATHPRTPSASINPKPAAQPLPRY